MAGKLVMLVEKVKEHWAKDILIDHFYPGLLMAHFYTWAFFVAHSAEYC